MVKWSGNLTNPGTDVSALIDGICERNKFSLYRLASLLECDHSFVSRIRAGERMPSDKWMRRFVDRCGLTTDETIRAYTVFGFVPAGFRLVPEERLRERDNAPVPA